MSRTLTSTLSSFVSTSSRHRGEDYFRGGRVTIVTSSPTEVSASVRGTRLYDVTLTLEANRLAARCTCPFFVDTFAPCKHIWAAMLGADQAGIFTVPARLRLDTDDDALAPDDALEDFDPHDGRDDVPWPPARTGRLTPAQRLAVAARMKQYWAERRRLSGEPSAAPAVRPPRPAPPPPWQTFLSQVRPPVVDGPPARALFTGEVVYVFDPSRSAAVGGVQVELMARDRRKSGDWARPKTLSLSRRDIAGLPNEHDRRLLDAVCGAEPSAGPSVYWGGYAGSLPVPSVFVLGPTLQRELMPQLCATDRLLLRVTSSADEARADATLTPVAWDPEPASVHVRITGDQTAGYTIGCAIRRGGDERAFSEVMFVTGGLVLWAPREAGARPRFATLDTGGADRWMAQWLHQGAVTVPAADAATLVEALATTGLVSVECPDELRLETRSEAPQPQLRITRQSADPRSRRYGPPGRLEATLSFRYGGHEADAWSAQTVIVDNERRVAFERNAEIERAAIARLQSLGVRRLVDWQTNRPRLELADTLLPTLVRVLLSEGWRVEAEGKLYRQPGAISLDVRSGIDWFELHGGVEFEGLRADLPTLLAAARRGDSFVALDDGTFGLLPTAWLAGSGRLAALGTPDGDHLRFAPAQTALLDAWLASEPAVTADEAFARARQELATFHGIAAVDPPPTFRGALRDYQREALGWFAFLRRFGVGGCLADEMGLGKTIMVLAALDARRAERGGAPGRASLVVVPRSLVFNWQQEAARFAPGLRVLDFTAGGRRDAVEAIGQHDLVLATYGTLRKDIGRLKEIAFDYAILDEAQAIKNSRTSTAKAVRLLKAEHRLALSGTPIENHLGELGSLFDFLNPGMLGPTTMFTAGGSSGRAIDDETLALLARGLRPFILRRTKEQVAAELPARTEQTLYCDLEPSQRALYDELRNHYRASLLGKVANVGLGRSKLQILEALLRLRQAACHPGLVDPARAGDAAAKLDVLLPRLQELADDGRKVLVFSQFTTLLGLLRARLDEANLTYEYLDGRTRDRQARVERFQGGSTPLFLISLRAGGLGLNLTAAEYVFLLDPWWNPAVEAQAIDRAHRIGQTRPVFAFRLIARDTVEEKVLELQAGKRRLAEAIVRADESLIRDLKREDLELLLS